MGDVCGFSIEGPDSCLVPGGFSVNRGFHGRVGDSCFLVGRFSGPTGVPTDRVMLVTNHVLAGAAIGAVVERPLPALALGVVSHLAMDRIPHWGLAHDDRHRDPMTNPTFLRVAYRDGFAGLAAMAAAFGLARGRRTAVLAGMVGAALLDLDKPGKHFVGASPFPAAVDRFHAEIQVGREHEHKMGQELVVAAGLGALVLGLCWARR
jgi:hypothetical protein